MRTGPELVGPFIESTVDRVAVHTGEQTGKVLSDHEGKSQWGQVEVSADVGIVLGPISHKLLDHQRQFFLGSSPSVSIQRR